MRNLILVLPACGLLACGAGPSQTGDIASCHGVTLSGSGAFTPFSGMAFQTAAQLGGGESGPGNYEVVIWGNPGDAGTPTQSYQVICPALLAGDFVATHFFVAPQTLELDLPAPLLSGSYQTTITDFTHPYSQATSLLEDIVGNVGVSNAGTMCLEGNFSANLVPVDPATGFAVDGGAVSPISGSFSLPYCGSL